MDHTSDLPPTTTPNTGSEESNEAGSDTQAQNQSLDSKGVEAGPSVANVSGTRHPTPDQKVTEPDGNQEATPNDSSEAAIGLKKRTKEDDVANLSSGSEPNEYWPELWEGLTPLPKRIKSAEKYRRQQHRYGRLLEDRLKYIESKIRQILKTPETDDDSDKASDAILSHPRATWISWSDYCKEKGLVIKGKRVALEILAEQPRLALTVTISNKKAVTLSSDTASALVPSGASSSSRTPYRIRINSAPIRKILSTAIARTDLRALESGPLVIQAPFKLLSYHRAQIMEYVQNLEEKHGETSLQTIPKVDSANSVQEDSTEQPSSTPEKQQTNEPGPSPADNVDAVDDQKSGKRAAPEKASAEDEKKDSEFLNSRRALEDMRCLVEFMDTYLVPLQNRLQEPTCKPGDLITFDELWHLFHPGQLVWVKDRDVTQKVWKAVQATGGRTFLSLDPDDVYGGRQANSPFTIQSYYLDYDGAAYFPSYKDFEIQKFTGGQPIRSLNVVPFVVAEKEGLVARNMLRQRGEQFMECTKVSHRFYAGRTLTHGPDGSWLERNRGDEGDFLASRKLHSEPVESPVMIDFDRALQTNPGWKPDPLEPPPFQINEREWLEHDEDLPAEVIEADFIWDRRRRTDALSADRWLMDQRKGIIPTGDEILLLPDRVFGFVLRSRKWACLQIGLDEEGNQRLSGIRPKSDSGWNDLQLPTGHKHIVQSLVEAHFAKDKSKSAHFDLIQDKGRGLIVLLHGAPGVGKTSTAECVAESNGKPLLPITCGDLGTTPGEVEERLTHNFQLAQSWKCVLLLDEADVFLAQRGTSDLERNALVSVFLRVLEYYEGLLFLTTNRVGTMDEAFKSRMHMALYYPALDHEQTLAIWKSQIQRAQQRMGELRLVQSEILQFAHDHFRSLWDLTGEGPGWNGRQIRNAFQSATALARHRANEEGSPLELRVSDLKEVSKASREFDEYLMRVKRGHRDDDWARRNMLRDDHWKTSTMMGGTAGGAMANPVPEPMGQLPYLQPTSLPTQSIPASTYQSSLYGVPAHRPAQMASTQMYAFPPGSYATPMAVDRSQQRFAYNPTYSQQAPHNAFAPIAPFVVQQQQPPQPQQPQPGQVYGVLGSGQQQQQNVQNPQELTQQPPTQPVFGQPGIMQPSMQPPMQSAMQPTMQQQPQPPSAGDNRGHF